MARGVVVEVALNLLHLPLVGFVRVCPSSDILRSRPLPTTLPLPSASQRYTGRLVPSSWFRTTSTVYSALEVPGLLHPGTGRGSPRFRRSPAACCPAVRRRPAGIRLVRALSRCALHTPRRSPPAGSRTALPQPLLPRRCASAGPLPKQLLPRRPSTSEPCSAVGSRAGSLPLPVAFRPLLPWAWFPSRVPGQLRLAATRRVSTPGRQALAVGPPATLPPPAPARLAVPLPARFPWAAIGPIPPAGFPCAIRAGAEALTRSCARRRSEVCPKRSVCGPTGRPPRRSALVPARNRGPSWGC
jgi:hypothetical protein